MQEELIHARQVTSSVEEVNHGTIRKEGHQNTL